MDKLDDIDKIFTFLNDVRKLQLTYRFTPKPDNSFESDAEHSWSVALTCMLLASRIEKEKKVKIDQLKLFKMSLIHDIGEIITGDTKTWDDKARFNKEENERKAVLDLTKNLPDDLKDEIISLWEECEKKESLEAKIVKSIDRFDPVIHRTVFNMGWDNVEKEHATVEALDERQLPRHQFSNILTSLYMKARNKALSEGILKKI